MFKKIVFNNCLNELYKLDIIWCVTSSDIRLIKLPISTSKQAHSMIKRVERFLINRSTRALNIHPEYLRYICSLFWNAQPYRVTTPYSSIPDCENEGVCLKSSIRQPEQLTFLEIFFYHFRLIQLACFVLSTAVLKCSLVSFVIVCYSRIRTYPWSYNIQPCHYRNNVHINDRYEFILYRCECRVALHMKLSVHYV
jgi:hypothetical protein